SQVTVWAIARAHNPSHFTVCEITLQFQALGRLPPPARVSGEEAVQSFGRVFGSLFRKKMARVERVALHIVTPRLPKRDWSAGPSIPSIKWPVSAPEGQ